MKTQWFSEGEGRGGAGSLNPVSQNSIGFPHQGICLKGGATRLVRTDRGVAMSVAQQAQPIQKLDWE